MKKLAKMAVGLTAVAMAASAFAGGPEMPANTINGFNIGLGFGYKTYTYHARVVDLTPGAFIDNFVDNTKFGPLGEIGYTFQLSNWAFIGLRVYYEYDNLYTTTLIGSYASNSALQSHLAALFLAGVLLNSSNAVYLEAGYSAMWGKKSLELANANGGAFVSATNNFTLSGGIAGIGWRHYFMNNVYLDLSYDFALYADDDTTLNVPPGISGGATAYPLTRIQVNGVTATLNYLFNV